MARQKVVNGVYYDLTAEEEAELDAEEDRIAKIKADNQAKIDKHLPEAKRLAREAYEKD